MIFDLAKSKISSPVLSSESLSKWEAPAMLALSAATLCAAGPAIDPVSYCAGPQSKLDFTQPASFNEVDVFPHVLGATPSASAMGWIPTLLSSGETVQEVRMIVCHEDAVGNVNAGNLSTMRWNVYAADSLAEMNLSSLAKQLRATLNGPSNADFNTNIVGTFLGYNLKECAFDLGGLGITNKFIAIVPFNTLQSSNMSVSLAFSRSGTSVQGTNVNFMYGSGDSFGTSFGPAPLGSISGLEASYFACSLKAEKIGLCYERNGDNLELRWYQNGKRTLQMLTDLNSGATTDLPGTAQTNFFSMPFDAASQKIFRLKETR